LGKYLFEKGSERVGNPKPGVDSDHIARIQARVPPPDRDVQHVAWEEDYVVPLDFREIGIPFRVWVLPCLLQLLWGLVNESIEIEKHLRI